MRKRPVGDLANEDLELVTSQMAELADDCMPPVGIGGPVRGGGIVEESRFDAAINYKFGDVGAAPGKHCPDGIDVNFENVGGEIMDQVIVRLNDFSGCRCVA